MSTTVRPPATGHDQLLAELALLDLLLEREVARLRASGLYSDSDFRGLYIADEHVDRLLDAGPLAAGGEPDLARAIAAGREQLDRVDAATREAGVGLPLTALTDTYALEPLDRQLLVIALACEVDLRYEQLFAYAANDVTRKRPTVELAQRLLAADLPGRAAVRSRLAAHAPLLRHRLVNVGQQAQEPQGTELPPLPARTLSCDRRVADFVLGVDTVDERLAPFTSRGPAPSRLGDLIVPPGVAAALPALVADLRGEPAVVLLRGTYGSGRSSLAAAVAAELDRPLLVADMRGAVRAQGCCIGTVFALLAREAQLTGAALLLTSFEVLFADEALAEFRARAVGAQLTQAGTPVFLSSSAPWEPPPPWPDCPFVTMQLGPTPYRQRIEAWRRALESGPATGVDVDARELAGKFGLTPGQVRDAVRDATHAARRGPRRDAHLTSDGLHAAARRQAAHQLGRYAQRIEPRRSWGDLVVSPRVLRQLREIERHVRRRSAVLSEWGFADRLSMADGVTVLFAGPSGTGKTLAAEILARELRLELFKVDLATVVSKYIGDTEKQLDSVFAAAHDSNAVLFFDEADATFGKRSEVSDAHDRYANIEVAYLLQKIEEYDGVVVLATNLRANIDDAFARRMQHTVEFALPRAAERRRMLDLLLPPGVPRSDDSDLDFLAERFELSGGNLRNVVVAAAFLAVEDTGPITMRHLVLATARELEKSGRLPSRADFGPYFPLLHEPAGPATA